VRFTEIVTTSGLLASHVLSWVVWASITQLYNLIGEIDMATKAQLIRDYITKNPDVGPTALAKRMTAENKGMKVSPSEISNIKSFIHKEQAQAQGQSAPPPAPAKGKSNGRVKSKPQPQARAKPQAPANGQVAPANRPAATSLAEQVGKLKAVVVAIGKDEAKQIIDLL
jgi:hypothetical protein